MNEKLSNDITPEEVRKLLRYDPETGQLFWRPREPSMFSPTAKRTAEHVCANWNARYANKLAFTARSVAGYKTGSIFNRNYYAHRVAWAIIHGSWPECEIDHINGDPSDNRLSNIRSASRAQNERNKGFRKNNTSGFQGVSLHSQMNKWVASITVDRVQKYLGVFDTAAEAHEAYRSAAKQFHQEYVREL